MHSTDELPKRIKEYSDAGYGLACMYVRSAPSGHVIETIMIGDKIERITAHVDGMAYNSVTPEIPSASLYEREIFETYGIRPEGHPDMRPLRSRTVWGDVTGGAAIPHNDAYGKGLFEIPVGPIHAGVKGPGHFRFSVAGEPVLMLRTYLGYSRRGIEKLMETKASLDNTVMAERISGDNAIAHSLAYLQTVEQETEIPERAKFIRTILAELERIYVHLGTIAGIAMDTSFAVPAAHGNMLRERILRLNERICGHRQLRGMLRVGGVSKDLDDDHLKNIKQEVANVGLETEGLFGLLERSASFMDRVETTGRLSREDAVRLRAVGPAARASGIDHDVRRSFPYAAYGDVKLDVPVCPDGDVHARLWVRVKEVSASVNVITQCIGSMTAGPVRTEVRTRDGFHVGITESPRGETLHCAHIEGGKIMRYKIRDASFPTWPALECAVLGNIVPDFPVVNCSFDLSYSGNDL
jgi:Ni,Fe-hydrogenase III large subunit